MSDNELLYEVRGTTGWVTLNRPQSRNALTFGMYDGLAEICRTVPTDGSVKCLVVTGAGEKAFAAGTDMTQFRGFNTDQDALDYEHRMDVVLGAVEACPVPTIAAISGACTGGGAGIAAACDIRITTADLRFGFPIARTLGNCLSIANLSRLSSLMGAGRTKEVIFTARLVGADEAQAIGLVSEIVPDHAALIARAEALAAQLAGHAPITLATTKEALRRLRIDGAGADDRDLVVKAYMSEDFKEGMEAFLGKRKPQWKGR
ncbi:enoyl-CoA hydratase/isomerase family protein [Aurantimonas sp. C2-6-R+9]|uniref:enoyl-CoA hydratase/isomerase family protein n=1 Tax=unclassified Aurantimonas TaxID=2638230 RepID=UPI002E18FDD1|nr:MULTISPECIES: enoyl-CoA hydratase/isomerase family protein [unclassified Aurantimonas]MEC5290537.1 enoyl-CoA hydratase/isomerase family protein [Aurantimonas sp. C2-3-R2]MEC5380454.1 enoyl-CoA hydratase/isomerase family protein [Aurantimonas sp. C2-6-R+9]MEC5411500.1 enoyl-CoA hydratase/isomerase family protein [Aurantimonas sp. C2-4-R8]